MSDGRALAASVALIAAPKLAWALLGGISVEFDSLSYLGPRLPYHHPPLYPMLVEIVGSISRHGMAIVLAQVAIFTAAATIFVRRFVSDTPGRLVVAAVLGLEPTSGFFCASLMSESIFQALLLVWLTAVDRYAAEARRPGAVWLVAIVGALTALLYATRLAAVILPPFVVLVSLVAARRPWVVARHALVFLLAFHAALVPFKLLFFQEYGRFALSMFTGSNLWNITSVLYPDSAVRDAPRTEFERFLAGRGTEEFTTLNALESNTLDDPTSAYDTFVRTHPFASIEAMNEFEHSLVDTARRLVLGNPFGYMTRFVAPSFAVVLWRDETIDVSADERVRTVIARRTGVLATAPVVYRASTWAIYFVLLVAATSVAVWRRPLRRSPAVLLGACWYYLIVLPVIAALFLRYVLVLAPAILVAAWLVSRRRA